MSRASPIRDADLPGKRFFRWTILRRSGSDRRNLRVVEAICDCGTVRRVAFKSIQGGNTTSCGCYRIEVAVARCRAMATHRRSKDPMYGRWWHMMSRCFDPKNDEFHNYGARGIAVCSRWRHVTAFSDDLGAPPSRRHSIDRIDNDGGYWCGHAECPDCGPVGRPCNVRWATPTEQMRNTRRTLWITIGGERRHATDVCEEHGTTSRTFHCRVHLGWDPVRAATTPTNATTAKNTAEQWRQRRIAAAKELTP